jgi:hypothetical protein
MNSGDGIAVGWLKTKLTPLMVTLIEKSDEFRKSKYLYVFFLN